MDPDNPRPRAPRDQGMSLSQVQRWVISVLAVTTVLHLSLGIALAAYFIDESRTVDRVGLLVIAGLFGMVSVATGLAIHQRRLLSPWLLLGWVPTLVAGLLIL